MLQLVLHLADVRIQSNPDDSKLGATRAGNGMPLPRAVTQYRIIWVAPCGRVVAELHTEAGPRVRSFIHHVDELLSSGPRLQ